MDSMIAKLRVSMGLDTVAFERGSKRAAAEVNALGSHMDKAGLAVGRMSKALVAGATAFGAVALGSILKDLVSEGLEYASSLGETAQQLGVSTTALQEYRYAASQVGIEQETMDNSLAKLTKSIGEAAAGSKKQAGAFSELGISLRDTNGKMITAGDAIPLIADALAKIPDPAIRARLETELFGKSGQKLDTLLSQGAAGVNSLRNAAHDLGIVLTPQMIDNADDAADKMGKLKQVLSAQIAAVVADNAKEISEFAEELTKFAVEAMRALSAWMKFRRTMNERGVINEETVRIINAKPWTEERKARARALVPANTDRMLGIKEKVVADGGIFGTVKRVEVGQFAASNGPAGFDPITGKLDTAGLLGHIKAVEQLEYKFAGMQETVSASTRSMADDIAAQMRRLDGDMVAPAKLATERVARLFEDMTRETRSLMSDLFPEVDARETYRRQSALIESSPAFANVREEAKRRLNAKYTTPDENAGWFEEWIDQGDRRIPVVLDKVNAALNGLKDNHKKVTGELINGNDNAARSFREMSDDVLGSLQNLVSGIQSGDFLSTLQGVINVLESLASVGLFGKTMADTVNKNRTKSRGYAVGTNFAAQGLAMVGERGPELINFRGGERVIPNHQLGGMGAQRVEIVDTTGLFRLRVNGQIMEAAPGIMEGGAKVAMSKSRWQQTRSLGR